MVESSLMVSTFEAACNTMKQISSAGWLRLEPRVNRIRREAYIEATKGIYQWQASIRADTLVL